jgi:hypothetical protein
MKKIDALFIFLKKTLGTGIKFGYPKIFFIFENQKLFQ